MAAPKDPIMLLSWANMKLRDSYPSPEELGYGEGIDPERGGGEDRDYRPEKG